MGCNRSIHASQCGPADPHDQARPSYAASAYTHRPATAGQLYLLDNARRNSAVGEVIRVLPRARAEALKLPEEDFWIFDSRVVALLEFNGDDLVGVDLVTNPVEVVSYCQAREAAWHYAVPFDRFQGVPSAE